MPKRRRIRQRLGRQTSLTPTDYELSPGVFNDVKTVALRLALADLTEDQLTRQAAVRTQLLYIYTGATPGLLCGLIGYYLAHFTDGLIRGYGSRTAAVDEITAALATAALAAGANDD